MSALQKEITGSAIGVWTNFLPLPDLFPEDLLREVFRRCLPAAHNPTFSPRHAPLLLTHVCRRWRDVATSTPSLWRSLHISLDHSPLDVTLALVDEWLKRARSLPLSISFSQPPADDPLTASRFTSYLKRLQGKPDSLETLTINLLGGEDDMRAFVSELDQRGFKPLRTVRKLDIRNDVLDTHNFIREISFFGALELHKNKDLRLLKLSASSYIFYVDPGLSYLPLPWKNLRVLDLQTQNFWEDKRFTIDASIIAIVLGWCPRLVEVRAFLSVVMPDEPEHSTLNPELRHASLLFPNLHNVRPGRIDLLAQCDWPTLSSLHLGIGSTCDPTPISTQIVEKWGDMLTSLRFTQPFIVQKRLAFFLSRLPKLIQLHIEDGVIRPMRQPIFASDGRGDSDELEWAQGQGEVFDSLTPGLEAGLTDHCCPQLQYFRWDGRSRFLDKAVIGLITSRALSPASPVRLKQVVINFHRGPQEDIGSACASQVASGLELKLTYNVSFPRDTKMPGGHRSLKLDESPREMGWM